MKKTDEIGQLWRHGVALFAASLILAGGVLHGCTRSGDETPTKSAAAAAIERVEGMSYYVGGPIMKYDKYGRMRLGGFNGEISSPTTRGLLVGFKKNDDATFDYRTWLNGAIITQSTGFVDTDGSLWYTERVTYDAKGVVVVRQKFVYDNEKQIMTSTLEHIDPESGDVVKTTSKDTPYAPTEAEKAAMEDDEEADDQPTPAQ